jgi:hypothetical protein
VRPHSHWLTNCRPALALADELKCWRRTADLRSAHARHRDHRLRAAIGGGSSRAARERCGLLPSIDVADGLLDERREAGRAALAGR